MYKLYNPETKEYSTSIDTNDMTAIKDNLDFIKKNYPELCPIWCIDMETGEVVY